MPFELQTHEPMRLILSGELDLSDAPDLKRVLDEHEFTALEIAAAEVDYMDSSAISVLLHARKLVAAHGNTIRFVSISQALEHILTSSHLHTLFDLDDAARSAD